MRVLVTGVDAAGRSCAVRHEDVTPAAQRGGTAFAHICETDTAVAPAQPNGRGEFVDVGLVRGVARWMVVVYEPDQVSTFHHTDTIDFALVLDGSADVVLDDGSHHVSAGDAVLMAGVGHAWRAGPEGCRFSVVAVGTARRR